MSAQGYEPSRMELLAWIYDLLGVQVARVEHLGSGGVYCAIVNTVFGDLPMSRVKMGAKQEYEYTENFKVLQKSFKDHQVDKPIPVDRLVKCKMQDNLEFTQWLKRWWDNNAPNGTGGAYEGQKLGATAHVSPSGLNGGAARRPAAASAVRPGSAPKARVPVGSRSAANGVGGPSGSSAAAAVARVQTQLDEMSSQCEGLEKERDFYFAKLRDIELIVQDRLSIVDSSVTAVEREVLTKIQTILYSTEDGFEIPAEGEQQLDPVNGLSDRLSAEHLPGEADEEAF